MRRMWLIVLTLVVFTGGTPFILSKLSSSEKKRVHEISNFCREVAITVEPNNYYAFAKLLAGTCGVESDFNPKIDKEGLTQITKDGFKTVQRHRTKELDRKIKSKFGIDMNKVRYSDIRKNYKVAVVCTAIYYKGALKNYKLTASNGGKAWKKYYNTYAGAGKISHYNKKMKLYSDIIKPALNSSSIDNNRTKVKNYIATTKVTKGKNSTTYELVRKPIQYRIEGSEGLYTLDSNGKSKLVKEGF